MLKPSRLIKSLLPIALLILAAYVLQREARSIQVSDVEASMKRVPALSLLGAIALTALNYLQLTLYDIFGLSYIGKRVTKWRAMFTSFIATAFGHNLGFSLLSGGSVRYRMYSSWGLSIIDVSKLIGFAALTFWVGFFGLGGSVFLFGSPDPRLLPAPITPAVLRVLGAVFVAIVACYFYVTARAQAPISIRGRQLFLPSTKLAVGQLGVGSAEWLI